MRVSQRLELIDRIGRELQQRYTYDEIDTYLAAFDLPRPTDVTVNSKWVYSKVALGNASLDNIIKIAEDLELAEAGGSYVPLPPPKNWGSGSDFRLFISHISSSKDKATRLKSCLEKYHISGFVAHEDIHPTLTWKHEILRALSTMDAFVSIHTEGFSKSIWTQQEIGYALARGTKMVALRMGEDPQGFISDAQALSRYQQTAEQIAKQMNTLFSEDSKTAARLAEAQPEFELGDEIPF